MAASTAWGAPVFLPTGENTSDKVYETKSWWERNPEEEAAEEEKKRLEEQQRSDAADSAIEKSNVSASAAAFYESHIATSIEELYNGVPIAVEIAGMSDLQSMTAMVDDSLHSPAAPHPVSAGTAGASGSVPSSVHTSTATLCSFSSPASKQLYWVSAFGSSLSIVNSQLELVSTISVCDALSESERMELIVNSADGAPEIRITALSANDEEQIAIGMNGSVLVFNLQLRNISYEAPIIESSKRELLFDPAAAWDELDSTGGAGNLPELDPTLPKSFRLTYVCKVECSRRGDIASLAYKTNNNSRAYTGVIVEEKQESPEAEDKPAAFRKRGTHSDDDDGEDSDEEEEKTMLERLAASKLHGANQAAPLPLRSELVVAYSSHDILSVDCFTFDQLKREYVRVWNVEGQEQREYRVKSEIFELGMKQSPSGASTRPSSTSSALMRVSPDGRALALAPFGAQSCNLHVMNLGVNSVLNVTPNPHGVSQAYSGLHLHMASQYGTIAAPQGQHAELLIGCVLEHPSPVVLFHFYQSTPSLIDKSSIVHPAIAASTQVTGDHVSAAIAVSGSRRTIPSSAAPTALHLDNLLLTLTADGTIRIWKQAVRNSNIFNQGPNPFNLMNVVRGGLTINAQLPPVPSVITTPQSANIPGSMKQGSSLSHSVSAENMAGMNPLARASSTGASSTKGGNFLSVPGQTSSHPTSRNGSGVPHTFSTPSLQALALGIDSSLHPLRSSPSQSSLASGLRSPEMESMPQNDPLEDLYNFEWYVATELEAPVALSANQHSVIHHHNSFIGASWVNDWYKPNVVDPLPTTPVATINGGAASPAPAVSMPNYNWHHPRLLTYDREGHISVWSIDDIYANPRCNPTFTQLCSLRTEAVSNANSSLPFNPFSSGPWLYARCTSTSLLSKADLLFSDSVIRSFVISTEGSMNLVELIVKKEQNEWKATPRLISSIGGHKLTHVQDEKKELTEEPEPIQPVISTLRSHPSLPLAASLGADGKVAIYSLPQAQLVQLNGEGGDRVKFLSLLSPTSGAYSTFAFYSYLLDQSRLLLFAVGDGFVDVWQSLYTSSDPNSAVHWVCVNHAELPDLVDIDTVNMHVIEPNPAAFDSAATAAADLQLVILTDQTAIVLSLPSKYPINAADVLPKHVPRRLSVGGPLSVRNSPTPVPTIKTVGKLPLPTCVDDITATASFLQRGSRNATRHVLVYGTSIGSIVLAELVYSPDSVPMFELRPMNGFEAHKGRAIESVKNINGLSYLVTMAASQSCCATEEEAAFQSFSTTATNPSAGQAMEYEIRVWSALTANDTYTACYDVKHILPPSVHAATATMDKASNAVTATSAHRQLGAVGMTRSTSNLSAGSATPTNSPPARRAPHPILPFFECVHSIGSGISAFLTSDPNGQLWIHSPLNIKQETQKRLDKQRRMLQSGGNAVDEAKSSDHLGSESWDCMPHPRIFPANYALLAGAFNSATLGAVLIGIPNGQIAAPSKTSLAKTLTHIPSTPLALIRHIHLHPLFTARHSLSYYHPQSLMENILAGQTIRVQNILAFVAQSIQLFEDRASENSDIESTSVTTESKRGGVVPIGPIPMDYLLCKAESSPFHTTPGSFVSPSTAASKPAAAAVSASDSGMLGGGFGSFGSFGSFGGGGFGSVAAAAFGSPAAAPVSTLTFNTPQPRKTFEFSEKTLADLLRFLKPPSVGSAAASVIYSLAHLTPSEHELFIRILQALQVVHENSKHLDEFAKRYLFQVELLNAERVELKKKVDAERANNKNEDEDSKLKGGAKQENPLDQLSLSSAAMCYAFHSASSETLLNLTTGPANPVLAEDPETSLTWPYVRSLGVGYWLSNVDLEALLLRVAKAQYMVRKSPNDCWLLYLAMKKKNLLLGLMKNSSKYAGVYDLMSSDFANDEDAVTRASQNGMRVIERNAELAIGFFLLAACGESDTSKPNKYMDLVLNICFRRLRDPQLAVVICRLFEGENSPSLKRMIEQDFLPMAMEKNDPYLMYMALVTQGRKRDAVNVLIHGYCQKNTIEESADKKASETAASPPMPFLAFTASFLYLLHCSPPSIGAQRSLPHVMRHIGTIQQSDLYVAQKRSAQLYVQRELSLLALETFPHDDVKVEIIEEAEEEAATPAVGAVSTQYDSQASGFANFGGGFGTNPTPKPAPAVDPAASGQFTGGGFGSFGGGFGQSTTPAAPPKPAVDPAASGQFGGGGGFGGFGSFGGFGQAPAPAAATPKPVVDSAASGQFGGGGGFGSFGSFGSFGQSSTPAASTPASTVDASASGQFGGGGGFGSFGSFGSFGQTPAPAPAPAPAAAAPAAFNLANFGSFGTGGASPAGASSAASAPLATTAPAVVKFQLRAPDSPLLSTELLAVTSRDAATFANKLRYAFTEMALESYFKIRLEEFIELVSDVTGVSLAAANTGAPVRRNSISAAEDGSSSAVVTPNTAAATQVSCLLYSLNSLHDDFALMLKTFDTYSQLTSLNKIWFKLQNHCFLHKSYMGALICSLFWQQFGPAPQAIPATPRSIASASGVSVPTSLKPLSVIQILLRESAALSALIAAREFSAFASIGSLGGSTLQYHLSQTYQQLLIIRDQMNFILMQSHTAAPSGASSSSPSKENPLFTRSKDLIKLEWNLLTTLIHTTLLLWSLELNDYQSIANILDSSFANSHIKHPKLSVQFTMPNAKVDATQTLPRQPSHILKNEIPLSNGYEYKVSFYIVDTSNGASQQKKFLCIFYNTYTACSRLLAKLHQAKGDPDVGYMRSGTALRVSFLDRQTPKDYKPAYVVYNRVLAVDLASTSEASSAEEDYLANPKLLQQKSVSGIKSDDQDSSVKASFASLIYCVVLQKVLSTFQRNLKNTMLAQIDPASPGPDRAEEVKGDIYSAFNQLNASLSHQLYSLNSRIATLFNSSIRKLTYAKLEYECLDLDEIEQAASGFQLPHHDKHARVYPVQEIIDACFLGGNEPSSTKTPNVADPVNPNSLPALIQSLHLDSPLKLLGSEIVRLFDLESIAAPKEVPFMHAPFDIYRRATVPNPASGGSSKVLAIPQSIVVNATDSRLIAIATSQGIREVNVEHAVKFRRRNRDLGLEDEEEQTFFSVLHRFDKYDVTIPPPPAVIMAGKSAPDPAAQFLNIYTNNPHLTSVAYPQPKVILAAILGGMIQSGPGVTNGPTASKFTTSGAVQVGGIASNQSSSGMAFTVGGASRVYEDFISASLKEMSMNSSSAAAVSERDLVATQLTAHPSLPLYVSISDKTRVLLWHFGWPTPLAEFSPKQPPHLLPRSAIKDKSEQKPEVVTRIRFHPVGNKLAATTENGKLLLWVFSYRAVGVTSTPSNTSLESHLIPACDSMEVHNKGAADLTWIPANCTASVGGNGNIVATAGESSSHYNVCLWNTLLPAEDRLLVSFKCHEKEGGAASVIHCSASNLLISGANKGGSINVFNLNTMQLIKRLEVGKSARIHRLAYDPLADMLLSGSADGSLRLWFCSNWTSAGEWNELYPKASFFASSSSNIVNAGVTDICTNGVDIFVSGSDGSVKYLSKKRHYCIASEFFTPAQLLISNSAPKIASPVQSTTSS